MGTGKLVHENSHQCDAQTSLETMVVFIRHSIAVGKVLETVANPP